MHRKNLICILFFFINTLLMYYVVDPFTFNVENFMLPPSPLSNWAKMREGEGKGVREGFDTFLIESSK